MSHFKERKEKNCLNCNAEVKGRYCYVCGQENTDPKQSVGHLVSHFFNDVTHFDGKFFSTLGILIRRPGLLTLEFIRGRKASYLDPVRMYIFTSAIFFLVFFGLFHVDEKADIGPILSRREQVAAMTDSALHVYTFKKYNDPAMTRATALAKAAEKDLKDSTEKINVIGTHYRSKHAYDSSQQQLPAARRDYGFKNKLIQKEFLIIETFRKDSGNFMKKVLVKILHNLPQLLFVSLPLFALLLKLLYRRRQFYYTDHVIFSIHLYISTFIILLASLALGKLQEQTKWHVLDWVQALLTTWLFLYLYKAMRRFYQQRRGKTILKFILLNVLAFFMMMILLIIFGIFNSFTTV